MNLHDNRTLTSLITMDITTGLFGLFLLACADSVQYWAKKCHDELKTIREQLEKR